MKIYDGRQSFSQWDINQRLTSNELKVGDILHFFNIKQPKALPLTAYEFNGQIVVDVPNILLQNSYPIVVFKWVNVDDSFATTERYEFQVEQRPRPSDYVYTQTECKTFEGLEDRLSDLENSVSIEGIAETVEQAVQDYLTKHPIQIDETDPTVPEWAKQSVKPTYTASEVGAVATSKLNSAINDALTQAKESGEFKGDPGDDYVITPDDYAEIAEIAAGLVEVPEGGGGENWELLQECDFDAETKAVEITENIADISEIIVVMQNTGTANFTFGWTGHKVNGKNFTTIAGVQLGANKKYFSHLYLSPICYAVSASGLGESYTSDSAKYAYISDGTEIGAINILEEYKFFVATGSNAHVWIYCKRKGC